MLDGYYYSYFPNGMLKSEIEYDNGKVISKVSYNEGGGKITTE